jgi:hypothetical protein
MSILGRLAKPEKRAGADDIERWLNTLSDEDLEVRIAELDKSLRANLGAEGLDCAGMSSKDVCAVVGEFEANGGRRPARFEREAS